MPSQRIKLTDDLSNELRKLREDHSDLNAQELSLRLNKNRGYISLLESYNRKDKKYIKVSEFCAICELLLGKDYQDHPRYRSIIERYTNDYLSNDYTQWQNHSSFSKLNPEVCASVDYEKEVMLSLKSFNETFKKQIKAADNNEKRFIILRSLNMLGHNLQSVPDMTIVLNSLPIYVCKNRDAFRQETTKKLLAIMDECIDRATMTPALYDIFSAPVIKNALNMGINHTEQALNVLKSMLNGNDAIGQLRSAYNEHVHEIRLICESIYITEGLVSPIDDAVQIDTPLICDHLKAMDALNKLLSQYLEKVLPMSEDYTEQLERDITEAQNPECQAHRFDGMEQN